MSVASTRSFAALVALCALPATTARAYCMSTIHEAVGSSCPEQCDLEGQPLFWAKPEIVYTLNSRIFPGMDEATERRIFAQSFAAWEGVRCAGAPVGFAFVQDSATTTELGVHHESGENRNVLALLSPGQWIAAGHGGAAFALTSVHYNTVTGKIFEADIEFNGTMPEFGECPAGGCTGSATTDLRNVATHEIGHFLGLGHSADPLSTMACDARPGDVDKRSLGQDDVAGLCAMYPPGEAFVPEPEPAAPSPVSSDGGCSTHAAHARGDGALWLVALAALSARRKRRAR